MSYSIKEIYFTIQGEGFQTGKEAIFCRFSGCNLWTGREEDRSKATCTFCDTDFSDTIETTAGLPSSATDINILFNSSANLLAKTVLIKMVIVMIIFFNIFPNY